MLFWWSLSSLTVFRLWHFLRNASCTIEVKMVGKPPYRLASCSMRSLNAFFAEQPRPLEPRKTSYETIVTGSGVAVYIEPLRSGWAGKWRWEADVYVYVQKSVFSTGPNSTVMPAIYSRGKKERKSKDEKGGIRTHADFHPNECSKQVWSTGKHCLSCKRCPRTTQAESHQLSKAWERKTSERIKKHVTLLQIE